MKLPSKLLPLCILCFFGHSYAHGGYGIDCTTPNFALILPGDTATYNFTCTNNTPATFYYFDVVFSGSSNVASNPASITWPHGPNKIKPSDTAFVSGTLTFLNPGNYILDFNKYYNGEEFLGIYCQNGANPSACPQISISPSASRFAYVTNIGGGVTVCDVSETTGQFSNCTDSGGTGEVFTQPGAISFLKLNSIEYAYVTSFVTPTGQPSPVFNCVVNTSNGQLSDCNQVAAVGGTAHILSVNFHATPSGVFYAYLGDGNFPDAHIYQCGVNPGNGVLTNCTAQNPVFDNGTLINSFRTFSGQTYLYVPDGNNGNPGEQVWQCAIDPLTGNLPSACVDAGAGAIFNGPAAITFATVGATVYAYVSNYNDSVVTGCQLDPTTGLMIASTCTTVNSAIYQPNGVRTLTFNGVSYLYIVDTTGQSVQMCPIQSDGSLGMCSDSGAGAIFNYPFDLKFLN